MGASKNMESGGVGYHAPNQVFR